jgi:general secretion pathway protein B
MSILLEALKKSERQRQLGETPTLQTSIDDQPQSQVGLNHWIPLSLMALSACVMVWFGWQQFRVPELGNDSAVPVAVAKTDVEPQPRTMTESFQAEGKSQEEQAVPPPAGSKKSEDEKTRLNRSFNDFTADNDEAEATPPTSNQIVAAELPSTQEAEPELEGEPESEPLKTRPRQSRAEPGQSGIEPHISEPISYWELPQGVRDDLPEIKITVLVYADKPDDRFLLTNGQRMAEKDELQDGLVLDEIRKDGAIFLYRKYRFLVKG